MIKSVISDARAAAGIFRDMQKMRKQGREVVIEKRLQIPFIKSGGFYNTVEGCAMSWLNREIVLRAQEAFASLPDEEKHRLQFAPQDGEFIDRARLWRDIFKPVMTEKQCLIAVSCIIEWYVHIKKMQTGKGGAS